LGDIAFLSSFIMPQSLVSCFRTRILCYHTIEKLLSSTCPLNTFIGRVRVFLDCKVLQVGMHNIPFYKLPSFRLTSITFLVFSIIISLLNGVFVSSVSFKKSS